jgi:xylulokinase
VPINHVNPAAKILWLKQNKPEAYDRAVVLLSPKDYAVYRMTGGAWTDYSIASKTMLFGLTEKDWCSDICREIGIDMDKLPLVQGAWQTAGHTTPEFEALTGLKAGTPVATGGGDDHCQALGGGAVEPGAVNIGSGTGSAWKALLDHPKPDLQGRVECHHHILPDTWIYWTGINATGDSVKWFIENFGLNGGGGDFARFEELAAGAEPGADGLLFYPHLWGARAPRFNPDATGVFFGITRTHRTEHFCRAILEGVAYQYVAILDVLGDLGVRPDVLTLVGGETHNQSWNQIKADVVGHPILIPVIQDGSPLGAAMLAGLAVDAYSCGSDAVARVIRWKHRVEPNASDTNRYSGLYEDYKTIYDILEPAYSVRTQSWRSG